MNIFIILYLFKLIFKYIYFNQMLIIYTVPLRHSSLLFIIIWSKLDLFINQR